MFSKETYCGVEYDPSIHCFLPLDFSITQADGRPILVPQDISAKAQT